MQTGNRITDYDYGGKIMIRKRVISILMSTAMLCTNIIPAMQVMASETPAAEEPEEEVQHTD